MELLWTFLFACGLKDNTKMLKNSQYFWTGLSGIWFLPILHSLTESSGQIILNKIKILHCFGILSYICIKKSNSIFCKSQKPYIVELNFRGLETSFWFWKGPKYACGTFFFAFFIKRIYQLVPIFHKIRKMVYLDNPVHKLLRISGNIANLQLFSVTLILDFSTNNSK